MPFISGFLLIRFIRGFRHSTYNNIDTGQPCLTDRFMSFFLLVSHKPSLEMLYHYILFLSI